MKILQFSASTFYLNIVFVSKYLNGLTYIRLKVLEISRPNGNPRFVLPWIVNPPDMTYSWLVLQNIRVLPLTPVDVTEMNMK